MIRSPKTNLTEQASTRAFSIQKKLLASVIVPALMIPLTSAAQLYWGQTDYEPDTTIYQGTTSTASNWYTDATGTTTSGSAPNGDDIIFNTTPANTNGGTVIVDSELAVNSITFNTTGATRFTHDAGNNQNILLGSGGITTSADTGTTSIGISSSNQLSVNLTDSQTWTNNSSSSLTVRYLGSQLGTGAKTLTMNANNSGRINVTFKVTDNESDPISLVIDSAGTGQVRLVAATGSSAFHGGTTVLRGTLYTTGTLGNGNVVLGNTSGSNDANMIVYGTSFANDLIVRAGSSGVKSISNTANSSASMSGDITLEDNLELSSISDLTISGDISGTGGITKTSRDSILTLSGNNTFTGNTTIEIGVFVLSQTGTMTFEIGDNGVNNFIDATASETSVTLDGTIYFGLDGAELEDGNSWTIVVSSDATYGDNFNVDGFTENNGVWTNGSGLTFSEASGQLSYAVPEPMTTALLFGLAALFVAGKRMRRKSSTSK